MTSSQDFGTYPTVGPPPTPGAFAAPPVPPSTYQLNRPQEQEPSTADVAKDQVSAVAGGAADATQHVASVAKEQVGQVSAEATQQVRQLMVQAQSELSEQAAAQQDKLAGGLHSFGDQLKSMAQNSDQSGVAIDLAHQAADKAHQFAGWLDDRDPGSVLSEVRAFARQRPGMFLAVALGAGLVAGRLARGLAADPDETAGQATTPPRPPAAGIAAGPRPTLDRPAPAGMLDGGTRPVDPDVYGTGAVPDWTGKSAAELGEPR